MLKNALFHTENDDCYHNFIKSCRTNIFLQNIEMDFPLIECLIILHGISVLCDVDTVSVEWDSHRCQKHGLIIVLLNDLSWAKVEVGVGVHPFAMNFIFQCLRL